MKQVMLHRNYMDKGSANLKNAVLNKVFGKLWGERRILPEVQPKNFKQLWEERMEGKK